MNSDTEYLKSMTGNLKSMRKDHHLCDVEIHTRDQTFFAHRCILAAGSPHLKSMLIYSYTDAGVVKINLDLDPKIFEVVLDYIYTGCLPLNLDNFDEVIKQCKLLGVDDISRFCCNNIETITNIENWTALVEMTSSCPDARDFLWKFAIDNLESLSLTESFVNLDYEHISLIVKSSQPNEALETKKAEEILKWLCFHHSRSEFMDYLFQSIDFSLISQLDHLENFVKTVCIPTPEHVLSGLRASYRCRSQSTTSTAKVTRVADRRRRKNPYTRKGRPSKISTEKAKLKTDSQNEQDNISNKLGGDSQPKHTPYELTEDLDVTETSATEINLSTETSTDAPTVQASNLSERYACDQSGCLFRSKHRGSLLRHRQTVHEKSRVRCRFCGAAVHRDELDEHFKSKHSRLPTCQICDKQMKSVQEVRLHILQYHTDKSTYKYSCEHCGERFHHRANFEGHVNSHNGVRNCVCERCHKSFSFQSSLLRHMKICKGPIVKAPKQYSCNICGLFFKAKEYLKQHMKGKHLESKNFSCVCGKSFSWRGSLANHKKYCKK